MLAPDVERLARRFGLSGVPMLVLGRWANRTVASPSRSSPSLLSCEPKADGWGAVKREWKKCVGGGARGRRERAGASNKKPLVVRTN